MTSGFAVRMHANSAVRTLAPGDNAHLPEHSLYGELREKAMKRLRKPFTQIIESAQNPGGGDFPWDKIMEFNRAKKTGDPDRAATLLREIDSIVNKTKP